MSTRTLHRFDQKLTSYERRKNQLVRDKIERRKVSIIFLQGTRTTTRTSHRRQVKRAATVPGRPQGSPCGNAPTGWPLNLTLMGRPQGCPYDGAGARSFIVEVDYKGAWLWSPIQLTQF